MDRDSSTVPATELGDQLGMERPSTAPHAPLETQLEALERRVEELERHFHTELADSRASRSYKDQGMPRHDDWHLDG